MIHRNPARWVRAWSAWIPLVVFWSLWWRLETWWWEKILHLPSEVCVDALTFNAMKDKVHGAVVSSWIEISPWPPSSGSNSESDYVHNQVSIVDIVSWHGAIGLLGTSLLERQRREIFHGYGAALKAAPLYLDHSRFNVAPVLKFARAINEWVCYCFRCPILSTTLFCLIITTEISFRFQFGEFLSASIA